MKAEQGMMRRRAPVWQAALWVSLLAFVILYASGGGLYNAAPLFEFQWPAWLMLDGWLGRAAQWHRAALWLLAQTGVVCLVYATSTPCRRRATLRQMREILGKKVFPPLTSLGMVSLLALVVTGAAMSRLPLTEGITASLGGDDALRVAHFAAMIAFTAASVLHGLGLGVRWIQARLGEPAAWRGARIS